MNIIKDIGKLTGKVLVFGGVYSNFQALQKMKQISEDLSILPENVICTGDVVAYCAQPEESVQEVINWGIHTIAGNVEIQLSEGQDDCGCNFRTGSRCNIFSNQWYPFAKDKLSVQSINWMKNLPEFIRFSYANRAVFALHSSFHHTSEYIFNSTPEEVLEKNFNDVNASVILAGHSGLPFHRIDEAQKTWINTGVIGMPANDGTPRVWYAILDDETGDFSFNHFSFEYDFHKTANLMRKYQLPSEYALTLETGIWDNCEILPEEEAALQGKAISF